MGPTTAAVVSELVATGYAHLTGFDQVSAAEDAPGRASFAFFPDPVCARIAMCLMDEGFVFQCEGEKSPTGDLQYGVREIRGASKTAVAEMFGSIFSSGLCQPAKGDFGEVAVALYLLLCGDVLRKTSNNDDLTKPYHSLSVDLVKWMNVAENRGVCKTEETRMNAAENKGVCNTEETSAFQVNCIQFFRQPLHLPLLKLAESSLLMSLYEKGCGIYCPNNTEAVDLVLPVLSHKEQSKSYLPIFVSVKNFGYMSPSEATGFLLDSLKELENGGVKHGLLILAIAGQDRSVDDISSELYKKAASCSNLQLKKALEKELQSVHDSIVARIVCIHDDEFGIHSALLAGGTQKKQQVSQVFGMHSEILHSNLGMKDPKKFAFGTQKYQKEAREVLEATVNCVSRYQPNNSEETSNDFSE